MNFQGQTFNKERITVDGHTFSHCVFNGTVIVFNGGDTGFSDCWFQEVGLDSDNPLIIAAWVFMRGFLSMQRGDRPEGSPLQ